MTAREAASSSAVYTLVDYTDVWGDAKNGWTVNDQTPVSNIYVADDASDKDILRYLKNMGYLNTDDMRRVCVEDNGDMIEIIARKGSYPIGRLQKKYDYKEVK